MGGSIHLSREHGVNPHLCFCPRCGGDSNMLMLTGSAHKYKCEVCGLVHIGRPKDGGCANPKCSAAGSRLIDQGELKPSEKLPGDLCESCRKEIETFKAEIDRGGVPIKCTDCGMEGVLKAENPIAQAVRAKNNGQVMGVEFDKTNCPKCGPSPIV